MPIIVEIWFENQLNQYIFSDFLDFNKFDFKLLPNINKLIIFNSNINWG